MATSEVAHQPGRSARRSRRRFAVDHGAGGQGLAQLLDQVALDHSRPQLTRSTPVSVDMIVATARPPRMRSTWDRGSCAAAAEPQPVRRGWSAVCGGGHGTLEVGHGHEDSLARPDHPDRNFRSRYHEK